MQGFIMEKQSKSKVPPGSKSIALYIPNEWKDRLGHIGVKMGHINLSSLVRMAISEFMLKHEGDDKNKSSGVSNNP
jgi:hypothetical protein